MKKTGKLKTAAGALVLAGILTLLAGLGALERADWPAEDAWYQSRSAADGDIILVTIDEKALEEIGPYNQWSREVIAQVLEVLNETEENRPAVIGVDVLYAGETDAEADRRLARAAGQYGNVVTACVAQFRNTFVEGENGVFRKEQFAILGLEEAYEELRSVTVQGHINAMLDEDGVLRHHLLTIKMPDGTVIPSMALAAVQKFWKFRGMDSGELPDVSATGFWYVPFCGVPGDFETVSVASLLSGQVSTARFAGKIVLVGPYAAGLQDSYITAADHARPMYGVEFQANAIQAMLWGEYKKEVPDGIQLAVLFVVLAAGVFGFWKRRVWVSTAIWLFLGGGWVFFCRAMYGAGWIFHVLWIPVGITVLYAGCIAANYIQAALERREVTARFKRYVAPEIVNEILKEGTGSLELGGKLTNIAVLFVDIRGFTPMSEMLKSNPKQLVEILNRYLTLIADSILRNGGTLDKFVGDAAMAFWGAPLEQEDYVMHAVQAAADMAKGAEGLSRELMERYGRTVSFGVGVHVGEAIVGNIGSPQRMDYTAIGDTVNTAARLEANAPGGTIYISRAVADALEGRIRVTSLGDTVKLKGKAEGFEVLIMEEIL